MRKLIPLVFLGAILCASTASARLTAIPLDELIARASEIVVVKVGDMVEGAPDDRGARFAVATVERTLKGELQGSFRFVATVSSSFMCDDMKYVKDEFAVFFLQPYKDGAYFVAAFGRGRMPFRVRAGVPYVVPGLDIIVPKQAITIPARSDEVIPRPAIELAWLESRIRAAAPKVALIRTPERIPHHRFENGVLHFSEYPSEALPRTCQLGGADSCLAMDSRPFAPCYVATELCVREGAEVLQVGPGAIADAGRAEPR